MRIAAILILIASSALAVDAHKTLGVKPSEVKSAPDKIEMTETDEFRRLRVEGFDALYNMDYKIARGKFEKMSQIMPEHPASYFYLASNFLFDELNSRRRLQIGLYSGDSFFAQDEEKVSQDVDKEFRRLVNLGIDMAKAALKKNPRDPGALYYQGSLHGLMALYETTIVRSFFSALSNGRESVNLHRKVIEIDPNFFDAYLTIGTYDYVVGSLPFFVKVLVKVGGISGSRDRGLQELNTVIEHGRIANDDAKVTLITLYSREKKYDESLKLLEQLSSKYPRNSLFKLERANMLIKLNRIDQGFQLYEEIVKDESIKKMGDLIHYQYGDALAGKGRNNEALDHFRAVTMIPDANSDLVSLAHLKTGQMLDLMGNRNGAIAQYDIVLSRENVLDSHEEAKKYKKRPYAL